MSNNNQLKRDILGGKIYSFKPAILPLGVVFYDFKDIEYELPFNFVSLQNNTNSRIKVVFATGNEIFLRKNQNKELENFNFEQCQVYNLDDTNEIIEGDLEIICQKQGLDEVKVSRQNALNNTGVLGVFKKVIGGVL